MVSADFGAPAGGFHSAAINTLVSCVVVFCVLAMLSVFRALLETPLLRAVVFGTGIALCAGSAALVFSVETQGSPASAASDFSLRVFSNALYGLMLCLWAQGLCDRSTRGVMLSVSIGMLIAGVVSTLITAFGPFRPMAYLALPAAALVSLGASTLLSKPATGHAAVPLDTAKRSRGALSFIPLYAFLIGFATTQFHTLSGSGDTASTNIGMLLAAGVIFAFIALFMVRFVEVKWFLLLSGVLFCVLILFWFILPRSSELIAIPAGTLHWASALLLMTVAYRPGSRSLDHASSMVCLLMALFYLGAGLGGFTIMLGISSREVIAAIAAMLLLITLVFASRQNGASLLVSESGSLNEGPRKRDLEEYARNRNLTPRETEVFLLLAEGNSLKHIADELCLSENTVKRHRTNVYAKLGIGSRQELIDMAKRELGRF